MVYARTVHRRQQMIPNLWVTLSGVISLLDPYFFISFPYLNFYGRKFLHLFLRFLSLFSRCFTWLSMYGQIQNIHQFGNKMHAHCAPNQPTNHPMIIFSFFSTLHKHKFWIFDSYFGFNFHWCTDILRVCVQLPSVAYSQPNGCVICVRKSAHIVANTVSWVSTKKKQTDKYRTHSLR